MIEGVPYGACGALAAVGGWVAWLGGRTEKKLRAGGSSELILTSRGLPLALPHLFGKLVFIGVHAVAAKNVPFCKGFGGFLL